MAITTTRVAAVAEERIPSLPSAAGTIEAIATEAADGVVAGIEGGLTMIVIIVAVEEEEVVVTMIPAPEGAEAVAPTVTTTTSMPVIATIIERVVHQTGEGENT
mmetsp:Transcript_16555/g.39643  ORF Transcript_16555/g.39643 Transcript_16555/m.39643 type:complete len:104 (+) Transcript_16555:728-1039(+)